MHPPAVNGIKETPVNNLGPSQFRQNEFAGFNDTVMLRAQLWKDTDAGVGTAHRRVVATRHEASTMMQ
jgi:hypothetical protein